MKILKNYSLQAKTDKNHLTSYQEMRIISSFLNWWHSQAVRQEPAKLPFLSSNLSATLHYSLEHMLYLIATPIGNLSDLTYRAVLTMQQCDYLLCEDTRKSSILLQHYQIRKPLQSFHLHNEKEKLPKVLQDLRTGMQIGLLSDGGTPGICDPGHLLIASCIQEELPFTALPGPCALIHALLLSGMKTHPFQFLGFLPRKENEILHLLPFVLSYPGVSIFYESPQRISATLHILSKAAPRTHVAVVREMTKTFEEAIRLPAEEAYRYFADHPPKGEIVLIIEGSMEEPLPSSPEDLIQELQTTYKLSLTDAIKTAAHLYKVPKQHLYKRFHTQDIAEN